MRAEQLAEKFDKVRKALWTNVAATWAHRAQETVDCQLDRAMQGVLAQGQTVCADPDRPGEKIGSLFNVAKLRAGLCPKPLLDHGIWKINPGADAGKDQVLVAIQAFDKLGSEISEVCECALIASSEDLRRLNAPTWTLSQLVDMAHRTQFDWGSKRAAEIGSNLVAAIGPLAKQAASEVAEKWYTSVRVLVALFAKGQTVPASQITAVLDSIPDKVGFEESIASFHTFLKEFLQAMRMVFGPKGNAKQALSSWQTVWRTWPAAQEASLVYMESQVVTDRVKSLIAHLRDSVQSTNSSALKALKGHLATGNEFLDAMVMDFVHESAFRGYVKKNGKILASATPLCLRLCKSCGRRSWTTVMPRAWWTKLRSWLQGCFTLSRYGQP